MKTKFTIAEFIYTTTNVFENFLLATPLFWKFVSKKDMVGLKSVVSWVVLYLYAISHTKMHQEKK